MRHEVVGSKREIEDLRGVKIGVTPVEEAIERGRAFMPESPVAPAVAPKPAEGGRPGGGRGRGGGRAGGGKKAPKKAKGSQPRAEGPGGAKGESAKVDDAAKGKTDTPPSEGDSGS